MALFYPYGVKMVHIQNVPAILMLQPVAAPNFRPPLAQKMGSPTLQRAPAMRYCKPPSVKGIRTYQGTWFHGSFMVQKLGISKFIRIISMKFLHLRPWKGQIMWLELVLMENMERSLESAVFFYSEKWSQTTIPLLTLWWACIDVKTIHLFFGNATKTSTNVRTDHEAIWLMNFDRSPRLTQCHFSTIPCYHWLSSGVIKHGAWKSAVRSNGKITYKS